MCDYSLSMYTSLSPSFPPSHSFSSSQSEESFSENSLPRRKRMFQNHSLALQPTHRRALSAHEYEGEEEEDSDDRMPPERWSAIGGRSKVGRSRGGGHNSDIPGISSPQRERLLTDLSMRRLEINKGNALYTHFVSLSSPFFPSPSLPPLSSPPPPLLILFFSLSYPPPSLPPPFPLSSHQLSTKACRWSSSLQTAADESYCWATPTTHCRS